jgi:hypothetical protein
VGIETISGSATTSVDAERLPRAADGGRVAVNALEADAARAHPVERVERVAWGICVATLVAWSVVYLAWPFSNDQGNLAWVGSVVLGGGMPYRDAWDVKGPAAHVLFALAQLLFGRHEWGLRLFDLGMLAVGALFLRRIVDAYAPRGAARWAIVLYLLWYASLDHHNTAQPDGWAAIFLIIAVSLLLTGERLSHTSGAGAGALIAACALIKPTYALFVALPVAQGLMQWRIARAGRVVRFWIVAGLGFVAPVALCVAWFVARGAFSDWIAVHVHWIPSSYAQLDAAWLNRGQYLLAFLTTERFAPAVPLVVGGLYVVRRQSRPDALVLSLWLAVALFGVLVQGQFYPYHWHPAYPPLAALAGLGLDAVWTWLRAHANIVRAPVRLDDERGGSRIVFVVAAALGAVVLIGAAIGPALHDYRFVKSLGTSGGVTNYDRVEFGPFGHHGGVFPELVNYVEANSSPADTVLVWGSAAGVNYLSARAAVTPFGFIQPLVDPPDTELRRQYRDRFMARLTSTPPRYIVALNQVACARAPSTAERQLMGRAEGLIRCLADLPALETFVSEHYVMHRTLGPLEVWRRR